MKAGKTVSVAIFSACLAACGGGGSGGNAVRPDSPPSSSPSRGSSLSEVPEQYKSKVREEKTISLENRITNGSGIDTYRYNLGNKTGEYNLSDLPNGRTDLPVTLSYESKGGVRGTASGTMLVYQQPYSVIMGANYTQLSGKAFEDDEPGIFFDDGAVGFSTPSTAITALVDQNASFDYNGVAFDGQEEATLNYTMDFGKRQGSGSISGFSRTGLIDLAPSALGDDGFVSGKALIEKGRGSVDYDLSFFGPNAEEIAGSVYDYYEESALGAGEIIFGGKR